MRVLSVADLGFGQKGGRLYLEYQRKKEQAAQKYQGGTLDALGLRAPLGGIMANFDPQASLQALLGASPGDVAAPPLPLFGPNSRYTGIPTATLTLPDGTTVVHAAPTPGPGAGGVRDRGGLHLRGGDRLDNVTYRQLGDPELFWRLCDANRVLSPEELEVLNRSIRISFPEGVAASTPANYDSPGGRHPSDDSWPAWACRCRSAAGSRRRVSARCTPTGPDNGFALTFALAKNSPLETLFLLAGGGVPPPARDLHHHTQWHAPGHHGWRDDGPRGANEAAVGVRACSRFAVPT